MAVPDFMIIYLSSIKPNLKKMHREKAKAQFTLTKHHIVSTKQGLGYELFKKPTSTLWGKKSYVILPNTMFLH